MSAIQIIAGDVSVAAELDDTPTARLILAALPIQGRAQTWGDEIYFEIPVAAEQEPDARAEVQIGELGYWPVGNAFCIFFGPTPASHGDAPRAASAVNVVGRVLGDATVFRTVPAGTPVELREAGDTADNWRKV
jgi:hypothetical protein